MAQFLDKAASFLNSKSFDIFGVTGSYSPAIYIALAGAVLVLIGFIIAVIAIACGKTKKYRAAVEDTTAYINSVGGIDANNVEGLNQRINALPAPIKAGWGNFMDQQTGYPSDYITEKNVVGDGKGGILTKAGRKFFNAYSWVVIVLLAGVTALGYKDFINAKVDNIVYFALTVIGALVAPIIVYIILRAILGGIYKGQFKKFRSAFLAFQDALDNNILIFRDEEEEFVSENIEEINANIEEILANRLNGTEILDIVTTPTVEEDDAISSFTEEELVAPAVEEPVIEAAPVVEEPAVEEPAIEAAPAVEDDFVPTPIVDLTAPEVEEVAAPVVEAAPEAEEVGASADELAAQMGMSEEEREKGSRLIRLVYIADQASKDPNMTEEQILELAQFIYDAKTSGDYPSQDEQEVFDACLTILANIGK